MSIPQTGIFALGTRAHHHLEFDTEIPSDLAPPLAKLNQTITSVAGVNMVFGFGSRLWAALHPHDKPADLEPFEPIVGSDGFTFPATQHDLWIWLHGGSADTVFDRAREVKEILGDAAVLAAEQSSRVHGASLDLTGFEDGTENPPLAEAIGVATIDSGSCAGGSIALVQRWVHDVPRFRKLPEREQEQVIGRTLVGSIELEPQPARSHVSRVVIQDDHGEELEVFRRSTAFGDLGENGLMFVGFSADRQRLHRMLERMAGMGDGERDHLTEFSTPTSGAWYIVPPSHFLF